MLEKRLGIAQLCLLLAVLVFMGLTRGSRGEALLDHGQTTVNINKSVREWSRRHLSFSGDWANRFRSRSPTPQPVTRSPGLGKGEGSFYSLMSSCTDTTTEQTKSNFLYQSLCPQHSLHAPLSQKIEPSRSNRCTHSQAKGVPLLQDLHHQLVNALEPLLPYGRPRVT